VVLIKTYFSGNEGFLFTDMAHDAVAGSNAVASGGSGGGGRVMPRELNDDDLFVRRFSLTPRESTAAAAASTVADRLADRLLDMRQSVIVTSAAAASQQRTSVADIFTTEASAAVAWRPPGGAESVGASPRSAGKKHTLKFILLVFNRKERRCTMQI
jgi:hypothetical protein